MATAAELADWTAARDAVLQSIATGKGVVEYEIRGRRVRRATPQLLLEYLQEQVERCARQIAQAGSTGRSRNYFQLHK